MTLVKQIFLSIFLLSNLFISPSISNDKFQEYGGDDDVENPF